MIVGVNIVILGSGCLTATFQFHWSPLMPEVYLQKGHCKLRSIGKFDLPVGPSPTHGFLRAGHVNSQKALSLVPALTNNGKLCCFFLNYYCYIYIMLVYIGTPIVPVVDLKSNY